METAGRVATVTLVMKQVDEVMAALRAINTKHNVLKHFAAGLITEDEALDALHARLHSEHCNDAPFGDNPHWELRGFDRTTEAEVHRIDISIDVLPTEGLGLGEVDVDTELRVKLEAVLGFELQVDLDYQLGLVRAPTTQRRESDTDHTLCITLLACLGELKSIIQRDAGTRYSGASIDFAYEAAWREFEKRATPEELVLQEQLHPRHIQEWLRSVLR